MNFLKDRFPLPSDSWVFIILIIFLLSGCFPDPYAFYYERNEAVKALILRNNPQYPDMNFAVISDPHYFAPDLAGQGKAFQKALKQDRKMLVEGPEILTVFINAIQESPVDFVIVCGDLTKDGEALSHRQFARQMETLVDEGIPVYIVPGNHDILNGRSSRYLDDRIERVPSVTPAVFMEIYKKLGYSQALDKDPFSLSYIIEPVPGLWLFALDSCRYQEHKPDEQSITDGKFYTETLIWIEEKLIEAMASNKAVIGFLHHGILEHYIGNQLHYADYLLEDHPFISEMFASYGMRFVFSGHFHAQDITKKKWHTDIPNHFLVDIETGSLVSHPAVWRRVEIRRQQMRLASCFIDAVDSHPHGFPAFAAQFLRERTLTLSRKILTLLNVPEEDQNLLNPQIADAYITHLAGDEGAPDHRPIKLAGLSPMGRLVSLIQGNLINSWYHDLEPDDNDLVIDMETGQTLTNQPSSLLGGNAPL